MKSHATSLFTFVMFNCENAYFGNIFLTFQFSSYSTGNGAKGKNRFPYFLPPWLNGHKMRCVTGQTKITKCCIALLTQSLEKSIDFTCKNVGLSYFFHHLGILMSK